MIKSVNNYTVTELFPPALHVVYVIPKYQREYTWGRREWEQLFFDIRENDNGYFLGSIICINQTGDALKEQELEVVDGQQRLTTISLLYAAAYQQLKTVSEHFELDLEEELLNLKRVLVLKKGKDSLRVTPQVQNSNQDDYRYVLSLAGILPSGKKAAAYAGVRRIMTAYKYFQESIGKLVDEKTGDVSALLEFLEKMNHANLVKIEVNSHSDAYTLFESLNNRGVPLTAIDLIKNKFLSHLDRIDPDGVDGYFEMWQSLLGQLGDDYNVQERFFRHFYNAFKEELNAPFRDKKEGGYPLGPIAQRSNLIHIFERLIQQDPKHYLDWLVQAGTSYARLLMDGRPVENELDRTLLELARVQGAPAYLLLLYLLERQQELGLGDDQLTRIVQTLVGFFVRRNLTETPAFHDLNYLFMRLVEGIGDRKNARLVKFIQRELIRVSADEATFRERLGGPVYEENKDLTRFLLCTLAERAMTRETTVDLWAKVDKKYVWTIEHVFPQGENIPRNWVEMIADGDAEKAREIQRQHVHRLGNLTISGYNSQLGNKDFENKKNRRDHKGNPIGYNNRLCLNDDLVKAKTWTGKQIEKRTQKLVDQIVELFPLEN